MAWPDLTDAIAYIGEVRQEDEYVLDDTLDAAIERIAYRCGLLDENGDPESSPTLKATQREAVLLQTSRWFRRRLTPEGVASFGEFGAVRVTTLDADIEAMITQTRSWGIA